MNNKTNIFNHNTKEERDKAIKEHNEFRESAIKGLRKYVLNRKTNEEIKKYFIENLHCNDRGVVGEEYNVIINKLSSDILKVARREKTREQVDIPQEVVQLFCCNYDKGIDKSKDKETEGRRLTPMRREKYTLDSIKKTILSELQNLFSL